MEAHVFNPSTREAKAGGSLSSEFEASLLYIVSGQSRTHRKRPCLSGDKAGGEFPAST